MLREKKLYYGKRGQWKLTLQAEQSRVFLIDANFVALDFLAKAHTKIPDIPV